MKEYKITVKDNIDEITTINHDNLQELFSCRGNFFTRFHRSPVKA